MEDIVITTSSGHDILENTVIATIRRIAPLPLPVWWCRSFSTCGGDFGQIKRWTPAMDSGYLKMGITKGV